MKAIFTFFIILCFFSCGKSPQKDTSAKSPQELITDTYLDMVNQHRKSLGLRTLSQSDLIADIAYEHSDQMAKGKVRFGHSGWKKRCKTLNEALGSHACSEIVAKGQKNTKEVFQAWLNSPSHRASLENPRYTHTALAFSQSLNGTLYWTQIFLDI